MSKRNRSANADHEVEDVESEQPASQKRRIATDRQNDEQEDRGPETPETRDFNIGEEAEVGIIEKVTLTNFMCHSYLEIAFGSNVNFVIGRNGSGKSAIMTAVLVGLGAKAAITSRGNSIKHFIKDSCSYAIVAIKLRNRGSDAYKEEVYGDSITIERKISRDGANSYKLKATDGKVYSTKKDELIIILDRFNIQIDNPISVLNQDTSRSFLNTSDAKTKYQFFLKATQLEEMSQDYQGVIQRKSQIDSLLKRKQEGIITDKIPDADLSTISHNASLMWQMSDPEVRKILPEMASQVKILEEKYQDQQQLRGLKEKVQLLKNELVWALVKEKKQELSAKEADLVKEESRLPRHDAKIKECQTSLAGHEAEWRRVNTEINTLAEDGNGIADRQAEAQRRYKEQRQSTKTKQEAARRISNQLYSTEQERSLLKDRIEEIRASASATDLHAERLQREQALETAMRDLDRYSAQLSISTHHHGQIELAMQNGKEKAYQARMEKNGAKRRLDDMNGKLINLKESQQNSMKLFGRWTPDLQRLIAAAAKQNKFHRTPIGPMGAHIKLKDNGWALGIEAGLKSVGLAYCCHDNHDRLLLRGLMSQVCGREKQPDVIVTLFTDHVHNTQQYAPRCEHPSILNMLEIRNPVVANCLIDQSQIESVLLIENPATARNVMWNKKPTNANKAYAMNGDEIIGGQSKKYYSNRFNQPRYLQQNVAEAMKQVAIDMDQQRKKVSEIESEANRIDSELKMHQTELREAKKKCRYEQDTINRLQENIQELQSYEEELPPDVTALEEEVETLELKINEQKLRAESSKTEFDDAATILQECTDEAKLCRQKVHDLMEKMDPLRNELHELEQKIATTKGHRVHYEKKKADFLKKTEEKKEFNEGLRKEYEEMVAKSSEFCEQVDTSRTPQNLESEIVQSERRITREERARGNPEEVATQYHTALNRYETVTSQFDSLKRFNKYLTKVLERRASRFKDFRSMITLRAKQYFLMMLSQRGYSGRIRIDHKKEELSVQVNVEQANGTASKDTRSLSGGERSFSTICFITALWEAMESPFRILDEFDVFMDMVNRRISMKSLLKIARLHSNRQFVFLTPQDMSNIDAGGNVRIFRLQDPERNQATISFPPATPS